MKFRIFSLLRLFEYSAQGVGKRVLLLALGMAVSAAGLCAQDAPAEANSDKQTIQMLLQRIERLEARVSQLEGTHAGAARTETAMAAHPPAGPAAGPATAPETAGQAAADPPEPGQGRERPETERKATTRN